MNRLKRDRLFYSISTGLSILLVGVLLVFGIAPWVAGLIQESHPAEGQMIVAPYVEEDGYYDTRWLGAPVVWTDRDNCEEGELTEDCEYVTITTVEIGIMANGIVVWRRRE